jgi:uncharacterized protein with HEPN domain
MDRKARKYLWDILEYTKEIEGMVQGISFNEFIQDRKLMLAVERCFEIIGIAVYEVDRLRTDLSISDKEKIIGMRNIIAHGYDTVEPVNIWNTIKNHLPKLRKEVESLLGDSAK